MDISMEYIGISSTYKLWTGDLSIAKKNKESIGIFIPNTGTNLDGSFWSSKGSNSNDGINDNDNDDNDNDDNDDSDDNDENYDNEDNDEKYDYIMTVMMGMMMMIMMMMMICSCKEEQVVDSICPRPKNNGASELQQQHT